MKTRFCVVLLLLGGLLVGCQSLSDALTPVSNPNPSAWVPVLPAELAPRNRANSRPIRPGDKVDITIHTNTAQNGGGTRSDIVDLMGNIKLALVGDVRIATLTTEEAEEAIRTAYVNGGFYTSLTVRVVCPDMIMDQLYYVDGETAKTGSFPFRDNLTLQQAIITAGGLNQFADGTIELRRGGVVTTHDFERISRGKAEDPRILPGDILVAKKRWF